MRHDMGFGPPIAPWRGLTGPHDSSGDQAGSEAKLGRRNPLLVAAGDIDGEQRRPGIPAGVTEQIVRCGDTSGLGV
jgi:hypothetical protein